MTITEDETYDFDSESLWVYDIRDVGDTYQREARDGKDHKI